MIDNYDLARAIKNLTMNEGELDCIFCTIVKALGLLEVTLHLSHPLLWLILYDVKLWNIQIDGYMSKNVTSLKVFLQLKRSSIDLFT